MTSGGAAHVGLPEVGGGQHQPQAMRSLSMMSRIRQAPYLHIGYTIASLVGWIRIHIDPDPCSQTIQIYSDPTDRSQWMCAL